jgi:hypothetical protein
MKMYVCARNRYLAVRVLTQLRLEVNGQLQIPAAFDVTPQCLLGIVHFL